MQRLGVWKQEKAFFFKYYTFHEQLRFHAQLSKKKVL